MIEIRNISLYADRMINGHDHSFYPPLSMQEVSDAQLDAEYSPYIDIHSRFEAFGVDDAIKQIAKNDIYSHLHTEIGVEKIEGRNVDTLILRWNPEKRGAIWVSQGVRLTREQESLNLDYLKPSNRPEKAIYERLDSETRQKTDKNISLGGWVNLMNIHKDQLDEKILKVSKESILTHWIEVTMKWAEKPYFDFRTGNSIDNLHGLSESTSRFKGKAFRYDTDEAIHDLHFLN